MLFKSFTSFTRCIFIASQLQEEDVSRYIDAKLHVKEHFTTISAAEKFTFSQTSGQKTVNLWQTTTRLCIRVKAKGTTK